MKYLPCLIGGLALAASPLLAQEEAPTAPPTVSLQWSADDAIGLKGQFDTHQLVLAVSRDGGLAEDATHRAKYATSPEGIVSVDSTGYVRALGNGEATITATVDGGTTQRKIVVTGCQTPEVISFPNEVVPIFTKHGCNGGGCHGKAEGQNGFKLSLFGYEPENDHGYLVQEARGRRIFRAAPRHSLILLKGSGELPHQGGSRLKRDGDDYKLLVRWINQGLSYGPKNDPKVTKIEVSPKEFLASRGAHQQLRVVAYFDNDTKRDITRAAQFEANDEEMAEVDENGWVELKSQPGSTSVMIRFQEHVDVFRATIPLGAPTDNFPEPINLVDERIFDKLKTLGLPPSDLCDDPTFLRRVSIDIAGRLPTLEETNAFIADTTEDKRARKIDELLASPAYADYFAGKWSAILRNKRKNASQAHGSFTFHSWIREALNRNVPYNEFVNDFVSATGEVSENPPVVWYRNVKDRKEQLQDVAQIFLGVRLQCAQCHHHPYEKWSQDDYYGFEAFFSTIGRKPGAQPGEELIYHKRSAASAQNPRTGKSIKPTPLGEEPLQLAPHQDPRQSLADWMVNEKNPFFAKMLVNRYWKHFFSRGLVDPEDDMRVTNPPTHPKLLNDLAQHFVDSRYDMKELVRTICNSRTYQLSAIPNQYNRKDQQNYSRFYPRRLPAEILLDGINQVTNAKEKFTGQPQGVRAVQLPDDLFTKNSYFLSVFGRPDMNSACECERADDVNLAQALHLVNSKNIRNKLAADNTRAAQLVKAKDRTDEDRIEELYRRALSRPPMPQELDIALAHLKKKRSRPPEEIPAPEPKKGEPKKEPAKKTPEMIDREAYEDMIWALLNTKEFLFNH